MNKLSKNIVCIGLVLTLFGCETVKTVNPDEARNALPAAPALKLSDAQPATPAEVKTPVIAAVAKAVEPEPTVARLKPEQVLAEGNELYEKGDFKGAIRKLVTVRDTSDAATVVKQNSLRLLAFSYCVTGQRALCKNQFSSLLAIAPDFQLSRAEVGHPLWGPVFKEAKSEKSTKTTKTSQKG
jgi:hypothetical protein